MVEHSRQCSYVRLPVIHISHSESYAVEELVGTLVKVEYAYNGALRLRKLHSFSPILNLRQCAATRTVCFVFPRFNYFFQEQPLHDCIISRATSF